MKKSLLCVALMSALAVPSIASAAWTFNPSIGVQVPGGGFVDSVTDVDKALGTEISKNGGAVSENRQHIVDLEASHNKLKNDLTDVITGMMEQDAWNVDLQNQKNADQDTAIKNLNDKVDANRVIWQQEISKDKLAIDQAQKDIASNKNEINGLHQDIAGIDQSLGILNDQDKVILGKTEENASNIADNKAAIEQSQKDIVANKEAIQDAQQAASGAFDTAMKAEMNNHRQDQILDKHGSEIASNTEAIRAHYAEMKNNFAAVNTRLDNLDDEMKKGFAANAAIAGLFQPYSVGKFNVTAALGGYDSEQAIAIGSGYRFNENFAMKAGVATNTSDFDAVTYNVGVNFEW